MNFKLSAILAFAFVCILSCGAISRELSARTYSCSKAGEDARGTIRIDNNSHQASFTSGDQEIRLPSVKMIAGNKNYYSFEGLNADATSRSRIEFNRLKLEARITLELGTRNQREFRTTSCRINNHFALIN